MGLNFNFYYHVIEGDNGPFERCTAPMVNLGTYEFQGLDTGKITPKIFFKNSYVEEVFESESVRTSNKLVCKILDT